MQSSFPFITTPEHVGAEELRRTRPALFTTIMAVTTRTTCQQKSVSTVVMKQLAERIAMNGERIGIFSWPHSHMPHGMSEST